MRKDLLALTEDDLVLLTNRGTVKRARREVDENEATVEVSTDEKDNLTFTWSDGAVSTFPAGATIRHAVCTCAATTICRHMVRSVFAYQKTGGASESSEHPSDSMLAPAAVPDVSPSVREFPTASNLPPAQLGAQLATQPWSPASITDEVLEKAIKPQVMKQARRMFNEEHVVEVMTGVKPLARFHTAPATVRFLVDGDPRYTHCNCVDEAPCVHVPVAVWAFRKAQQAAAIVSTQVKSHSLSPCVSDADTLLREVARVGISGITSMSLQSFHRAMERCLEDELSWPAELLHDLLDERDKYHQADARFSGERVVELVGELVARLDALKANTGSVPRAFIAGTKDTRTASLTSIQLVGLGCGVATRRQTYTFTAYFQDPSAASLVGIERQYVESPEAPTAAFHVIAAGTLIRGHNLAELAAGQILAKGGKLSPARLFEPGRAQLVLNSQAYDWETRIKPPVLVENLQELRAMLSVKPPSYLAPRHLGQRFHVVGVEKVQDVRFRDSLQAVVGRVFDHNGNEAQLFHPYIENGSAGVDALLAALTDSKSRCRLIAGHFHNTPHGLSVRPVSIIMESKNGRSMLQPYVQAPSKLERGDEQHESHVVPHDPIADFLQELADALAELLIAGAERISDHAHETWARLEMQADTLGFVWLKSEIAKLTKELHAKQNQLNWRADELISQILTLCLLFEIAQDSLL